MNRRNVLKLFLAAPIVGLLPVKKSDPRIFYAKVPLVCGNKDLFISKEGIEDIRNWSVDYIDEQTRKEIFLNGFSTTYYSVSQGQRKRS